MSMVYTSGNVFGPSVKLTYAQVCEMMDVIRIRQTQAAQSYSDLTAQAEEIQKTGYLNLAKIRYVQGPHSVSKDRLPTENSEEAQAFISVNVYVVEEVDPVDGSIFLYQQREAEHLKDPAKQAQLLQKICGALPPNCAKEAQKNFLKTVELQLERQNIREELEMIGRKYKSLEKLKKAMIDNNIPTSTGLLNSGVQKTW